MLYTIPDYYKEFTCIADKCEDTCCAGWQIVVDKKSLKKYRHVRSPYLPILLKRINWLHGTFRQDKERRCVFLRDDNLCDMYIHLGGESICKTCRLYPRHIEEFEGVREISLSVSCPEVARILMTRETPVTYQSVENDKEEIYEEFDPFLYSMLLDCRDSMIEILQNRALPVEVRSGLVYGMARDIQRRINRQELFACLDVIEKYKKDAAAKYVAEQLEQNKAEKRGIFEFQKTMFQNLYQLELLKEDWYVLLKEVEHRLFEVEDALEGYAQITAEFHEWISEHQFPWEIQKEQLLVYFVFTYLCGAVYDGQVLDKVQMAVISVNLLEDMMKVRWLRNEKLLDMEDVIELVYRYSREVEHSDINLKRMERLMPRKHGRYEKG